MSCLKPAYFLDDRCEGEISLESGVRLDVYWFKSCNILVDFFPPDDWRLVRELFLETEVFKTEIHYS